jgi:hypothetical protein
VEKKDREIREIEGLWRGRLREKEEVLEKKDKDI